MAHYLLLEKCNACSNERACFHDFLLGDFKMTVSKKHTGSEMCGHSMGCADHDYDLVQDLGHRLDAIWHYDEHFANAKGRDKIQAYWADVKKQDEENVKRLKLLIADEIKHGCF